MFFFGQDTKADPTWKINMFFFTTRSVCVYKQKGAIALERNTVALN